ncbi:MAG: LicD family protein [Ruminococcus sp.]|nr:LicD family protein [Ruminococcus sp.]
MVDLKLDIPKEFFEEEVRCGFTVTKERKELWAVGLDLLNELIRVCKKHKINIYVSDGTLLGAVRHKGMIPWDDDIDTVMLREDYERLCKIAPKEFKHPYFFQNEETDPGSMRGHAQLRNSETTGILKCELELGCKFNQGIFIDIFPLDNVPDDEDELQRYLSKNMKLIKKKQLWSRNTDRYVKSKKPGIKSKLKNLIAPISRDFTRFFKIKNPYYKKLEKLKLKYRFTDTEWIGELTLPYIYERGFKRLKTDYVGTPRYMDFEMIKVPVPLNCEDNLTREYGNWKEFEMGSSVHGGVIFDANVSYKEYLKNKG